MERIKSLVVGLDLSDDQHLVSSRTIDRASKAALNKAVWIAQRARAAVHAVTVLEVEAQAEARIRHDSDTGQAGVIAAATMRLEELLLPAREVGLEVTTEVTFGKPSRAILADVLANDRDLAVVGAGYRGRLKRILLGSTALDLLRRCPKPVWVARRGPEHPFRVVLAPVGYSSIVPRVIQIAHGVATALQAQLHVAHFMDEGAEEILRSADAADARIHEFHKTRADHAEAHLAKMIAENAPGDAEVTTHLCEGQLTNEIPRLATELEADCVVIGSTMHGRIGAILLGDKAEAVLPRLDTSLVVVKAEGFEPPAED
jgi:universal stress protein E